MDKAQNIVERAAEALERITGQQVSYEQEAGAITWINDDTRITLDIVEAGRPTTADLAKLIDIADRADSVLVAAYFPTEHRRILREAGVNYVDAAGNAYVKTPETMVFIEGQAAKNTATGKQIVGRAFKPAGLRVLLPLLVNPDRVNETYRELADRIEVSPTTVKHALDDLERRGYVVKIGLGRGMSRRLRNVHELARTWASNYGDHLRPKLVVGRYRFLNRPVATGWKTIHLNPETSCWGSEPAADVYGGQLRPEILTLYSSGNKAELARSLRVVPDDDGPIEILEKFWSNDVEIVDGIPVAPRLLVYADLLASGEVRNLETAQPIFDSWADAEANQ